MGEKMSLEQVRDWHREKSNLARCDEDVQKARLHDAMADALDAHITQPAQAVDVGVLVAVYDAVHRSCLTRDVKTPETKARIVRNALTAALPNANGKEG